MSNSRAVAAVTAALRFLLEHSVDTGLTVTARHPDRARTGLTGDQINLFLYHIGQDAAWRNTELPQDRTGASGFLPPLALSLEYLVTVFAEPKAGEDEDIASQRLLGLAMSVLNDTPVLDRDLLDTALAESDVGRQPDRVRITMASLSADDLSKLWTSFQTSFRLSAAYTASVVLLESTRDRRTPLPVLRRGKNDEGVMSRAGSGPALSRAFADVGLPEGAFVGARLGDTIVIDGTGLSGDDRLRFHRSGRADIELDQVTGGSSARVRVQLPPETMANARRAWAPGTYLVSVVRRDPSGSEYSSNQVAVAVAPRITVAPRQALAGDVRLVVTCSPQLKAGQPVALLIGERQLAPTSLVLNDGTDDPSQLTFDVADLAAGTHVIRIRVDGVDSVAARLPPPPGQPLEFDPEQRVVVS